MQQPEAVVATSLHLWQCLSLSLISIIGDSGFQSMYIRSLFLAAARFPWLPRSSHVAMLKNGNTTRFDTLHAALAAQAQQDAHEAAEAGIVMLQTFVDILALLIGEHLTTSILVSAWGDVALDSAAKDL